MSEDKKQRGLQMPARILHAADHVGGDHITGQANNKEIPEALIKQQFDRDAGVATG